ncbi:hypothetical protein PENTCL1PPCAC_5411, partial [Pristionchus entomophagus]
TPPDFQRAERELMSKGNLMARRDLELFVRISEIVSGICLQHVQELNRVRYQNLKRRLARYGRTKL